MKNLYEIGIPTPRFANVYIGQRGTFIQQKQSKDEVKGVYKGEVVGIYPTTFTVKLDNGYPMNFSKQLMYNENWQPDKVS